MVGIEAEKSKLEVGTKIIRHNSTSDGSVLKEENNCMEFLNIT